ncbi:hypothetical protein RA28_19525 [Ruegeria sp. ANG-S4]|uniref:DUF2155 domain-containing protein n=1 Tax=Ruegeria sp. ANG-S4 TaxID=1577904 RepID=UPI00057E1AD7|nr:DUF2155 domain-containing protein [Ruegeria sp. ANG-S4]KIC43819.1 hypothetical protein RA28_19525 [Ruegeria sp. ANG-S4]
MIRCALFALSLAATGASAQQKVESGPGAMLRGLDKVSGQSVDVQVQSGETATVFGLDVALGDCRYPVDNPTGDAFAYLTVWEQGKSEQLFDGWMIATSPALNALDHARYDVWVIRCITP